MTSVRATCWSITINNPTKDDEDDIQRARATPGWRVEGQLERGENGTPHYQLLVRSPQVRFSAMKKAFPRGHIEVARNPGALSNYVAKEETREGALPAEDNKYPSLNKYWDMIYEHFNTDDKDGWDRFDDAEVHFFREVDQVELDSNPLDWFDAITGLFIKKGYYVEHHAVNPAVRSQWKRFYKNILFRARDRSRKNAEDRQTDSQRVEIQEIVIPTHDITNADENPRQPQGLPRSRWYASCEDSEDDYEGQSEEPGSLSEGRSTECSETSDGSCD